MKFGIKPEHFDILKKNVIDPLKKNGATVWIFGSRATGKHQPYSDVDLLYELPPETKLPSGFIFMIKDDLEESRFPFKLDLVERKNLAESYREQIERQKILLT